MQSAMLTKRQIHGKYPPSSLTLADALSQTKATGLLGSSCKHESLLWQHPEIDLLYSIYSDSIFAKDDVSTKIYDPRDDWAALQSLGPAGRELTSE